MNALYGSGAETLADLARATRDDIAQLRCIGAKSVTAAEHALHAAGLRFATASRWEHCGDRLSREYLRSIRDLGWMCLCCGAVARPLAAVAVDPRWQLDELRAVARAYLDAQVELRGLVETEAAADESREFRVRSATWNVRDAEKELRTRLGACP